MVEVTYLAGMSWFAALLILGLLISSFAERTKFSDVLFLIFLGILIKTYYSIDIYDIFSKVVLVTFSVFALIMIVFDSSSAFNIKELQKISPYVLKTVLIFAGVVMVSMGFATHFFFAENIFDLNFLLLGILFAGLNTGTDPSITLTMLKGKNHKLLKLIEVESILNTPFTVIFPLLILGIILEGKFQTSGFVLQFLQQIFTAAGTGIIIGILIFWMMKNYYSKTISPLLIIGVVLGTYAIAENLGGNGVLAVTVLGLVYGLSKIKEKVGITTFNRDFTSFLRIIVFILLGFIIIIPSSVEFIVKSIMLFAVYIFIRYFSLYLSFYGSDITPKEKWFMALNISKGVAVVVVILILSTVNIPNIEKILSLTMLFIIYSIITATIANVFAGKLLNLAESEKKTFERLKGTKIKAPKSFNGVKE